MCGRTFPILLAVWMFAYGAVVAQEIDPSVDPNFDDSPAMMVETCLSDAQQSDRIREACIGVSVAPCATDALTTVEMLSCLMPEIEAWESRLQTALDALRDLYAEQDADDDPARSLAPRLDTYQAQWRTWRDAKCGFDYDKFRGGSLGRITSADCRLDETARRVFELEDLIEEAGL